jgi:hypothetical protein
MADRKAPGSLFIKDLIRRVDSELRESQAEREASGQAAIFAVEKLTLEVNFVVTESAQGKGGLDFKIITIGGEKGYEQQQVHKVTLQLAAVPQRAPGSLALTDLEEEPRFRPREE